MRFAYLYFMKNEPHRMRTVAPRYGSYWHTRGLTYYQGVRFSIAHVHSRVRRNGQARVAGLEQAMVKSPDVV